MRIAKKAEGGDVLRRKGTLDLKGNEYRGFSIITQEQRRRHKKKDTMDISELTGNA